MENERDDNAVETHAYNPLYNMHAVTEIKTVVLVVAIQTKVFSGSARLHRAWVIDAESFRSSES